MLEGAQEADLTEALYAVGWPAAAAIITDVLALGDDPSEPYAVVVEDALVADPDVSVTYLHPVRLRHTRTVGFRDGDVDEP
ncbi:hypothetical protein ACFXDH_50255 [Streptomyces sp. NPDC059467]|uniref:hypothetical protein n=1 Tax=Streptomyces sp. NPDC059467 TaxID=3346844 RepID=UPI00369BE782